MKKKIQRIPVRMALGPFSAGALWTGGASWSLCPSHKKVLCARLFWISKGRLDLQQTIAIGQRHLHQSA